MKMTPEKKMEPRKSFDFIMIVGGIIPKDSPLLKEDNNQEYPLKCIGYPIKPMTLYFSDLEELKKERKERKANDKANQQRWAADNKKSINNKNRGVKPRKR